MQPQTQLFSHFSKRRLLDQVIFDSMREMFRQEIKNTSQIFRPNLDVYSFRSDVHFILVKPKFKFLNQIVLTEN